MFRIGPAACALLVAACATGDETAPALAAAATPDASALIGVWRIDLRPEPGAAAYFKTFEVTAAGPAFEGEFYDTPIENVAVNRDWGALRIAFTTGDKSGTYAHVATLEGGKLVGMTHAIGRGFLAYWTGERVSD